MLHDLAAPHPARFAAPQRAGETLAPHRARRAQRLRSVDVAWGLGAPAVREVRMARKSAWGSPADRIDGLGVARQGREPGRFSARLVDRTSRGTAPAGLAHSCSKTLSLVRQARVVTESVRGVGDRDHSG